jgi:hypothetical protein
VAAGTVVVPDLVLAEAGGFLSAGDSHHSAELADAIADRETIKPEDMRSIGVRVIQDESFFIEPKLAELDNRQTSEAA